MSKISRFSAGWILFFWVATGWASASPLGKKVITSIKPLALITQHLVSGGHISVEPLLPPTASPHHYTLKISDVKRLKEADLIIWMGPQLEPYIKIQKNQASLSLLGRISKDKLIMEHEEHHHHQHHHNGKEHSIDPHLWLDPLFAIEIAQSMSLELSRQFPEDKDLVKANLSKFEAEVREIDQSLKSSLEPYQKIPFITYHDAYGYFVRRYGLSEPAVVQTQIGGGGLSVSHMAKLAAQGKSAKSLCLFAEPQFASAVLPHLGDGVIVRKGLLDPLGIDASTYGELLRSLEREMLDCFQQLP